MDSGGSSRLVNDSFVIYLSSADYLYPNNTPTDFTYSLPLPLLLEGNWTVTLLQFYEDRSTGLSKRSGQEGMSFVYICCDICDYSLVNDIWTPLLKLFPANTPSVSSVRFLSFPRDTENFHEAVRIRPLPNNELRTLRIWLIDEKGNLFSDVKGPSRCALRFDKVPESHAFSKFVPSFRSL